MMVMFEKPVPLRHIGHLDLMRTMQRALRRSGLPVRYSRGFNPHIRLSFASPLGVGIAGEREIMDVVMDGECGEEEFLERLSRVMPGSLRAVGARSIGDSFPTLMGIAAGSRYRIETDVPAGALAEAVNRLLSTDGYKAVRKTKSGEAVCDILPYIQTLEIRNGAVLFTALNLQSGSLRPSVVMDALFALSDIEPCGYTAIREAILAKNAQGNLVPLEVISKDG
jgi:radical SAM-linked protein